MDLSKILGRLQLQHREIPSRVEQNIADEFAKLFPESVHILNKFRYNPLGSNREELTYLLATNIDRTARLLAYLGLTDVKLEATNLNLPQPQTEWKSAAGQVHEIDTSPEAYKRMLDKLHEDRYTYTGLAIVPFAGSLRVYLY
jgi:hypothetical protein